MQHVFVQFTATGGNKSLEYLRCFNICQW